MSGTTFSSPEAAVSLNLFSRFSAALLLWSSLRCEYRLAIWRIVSKNRHPDASYRAFSLAWSPYLGLIEGLADQGKAKLS